MVAFRTFDVNGDGKIEVHELKEVLPTGGAANTREGLP